jgi:hypothetical protein
MCWLKDRRARACCTFHEAAEPRHIFVMLGEQNGEEPLGWNEAEEMTVIVEDGEGALAVLYGLPRRNFLVDAVPRNRWIGVHECAGGGIVMRTHDVFDPQQSAEMRPIADRDVTDGVVTSLSEALTDAGRRQRRLHDHHVARH